MKPQNMIPGCKYIRKEPVVYIPHKFSDYTFCDTPLIFVKMLSDGSPMFKQSASCNINPETGKITLTNEIYRVLPLEFVDDNWELFQDKSQKYKLNF